MWAAAGGFSPQTENLMKRLWLPVAIGLAGMVGCSSDAPTPPPSGNDDVQLSPGVMAQMESLIAEKAARYLDLQPHEELGKTSGPGRVALTNASHR